MMSYIVRRLLLSVVIIVAVSILTFLLTRVVPSAPARVWLGPHATREQISSLRIRLGLDKPIPIQYYRYVKDFLRGDWGMSIQSHQPVLRELMTYLPPSVELISLGICLASLIGISLGVLSAARAGTMLDHISRLVSVGGMALPIFWFAMILQLVFFKELKLFPLRGRVDLVIELTHPIKHLTGLYLFDSLVTGNIAAFRSALGHMILPGISLAIYSAGMFTRMTRAAMLEILGTDYIRTAKAYGLPELRILVIYALRNALAPVITIWTMSIAFMLVETFLIESVFSWPGIGLYAARAFMTIDYPAIMGITLLICLTYIVLNLVADICLALVDPRIRLQ